MRLIREKFYGWRHDNSILRSVDNIYKPYRIGFLLINEFSLLAFASALEPLRAANTQAGQKLFEWIIASATGISVTASNGTVVNAEFDLKILDQCHMVLCFVQSKST